MPENFKNLPMSKILPAAIVGLIALGGAGAVVGNWALDMWYSSVRTDGWYAKQLSAPAPKVELPKDTYLCPEKSKNPWIGCTIK